MNLKQLRKRAELRILDVAYRLNVAESTVRNWETGRTLPTLNPCEMLTLCQMYKVSLEELAAIAMSSYEEHKRKIAK
ncbi:helix-turn-helix transcriptional regulator [Calothrix sp. FACHB-156]|nr:helix-turn-helix transcriptional regulator [Calothrix sp. FACHB-156]